MAGLVKLGWRPPPLTDQQASRLIDDIVDAGHHEHGAPSNITLSERETEILELTAQGLSEQEVADELHIGRETVKDHNVQIKLKLGAKNAAHAVAIALREGWIQ